VLLQVTVYVFVLAGYTSALPDVVLFVTKSGLVHESAYDDDHEMTEPLPLVTEAGEALIDAVTC
jgi:hypothetical protein